LNLLAVHFRDAIAFPDAHLLGGRALEDAHDRDALAAFADDVHAEAGVPVAAADLLLAVLATLLTEPTAALRLVAELAVAAELAVLAELLAAELAVAVRLGEARSLALRTEARVILPVDLHAALAALIAALAGLLIALPGLVVALAILLVSLPTLPTLPILLVVAIFVIVVASIVALSFLFLPSPLLFLPLPFLFVVFLLSLRGALTARLVGSLLLLLLGQREAGREGNQCQASDAACPNPRS
jgi:hypothetical protein